MIGPETIFTSSGGVKVTTTPANMKTIQALVDQYEAENEAPKPPIVKVRTFEAVQSGRGFDEVEDKDDEDYKLATVKHQTHIWFIFETFFLRHCISNIEGDLASLMANDEDRKALFKHILDNSQITSKAVDDAIVRLGYTYRNVAIHEWKTPAGKSAMTLQEMAYQAGAEMYKLPSWRVDELPIPTQVEMLARYVSLQKVRYLEAKDRQKEMERKSKRKRRR